MNKLSWSFYKVWNESLKQGRSEKELQPRDHIWATEIGGSYIDRYLKMKGEKPSNPFNPRSLRKFEAGNLMEWVVWLVLRRAGILISKQDWLAYQYPGLLKVTGKLDFLVGGKPDWERAESEVKQLELPEFFNRASTAIIKHFSEKFPGGLKELVFGIKSCSSFKFDSYEANGVDPRHACQEFHYLKAKDMPEAHNIYICKDDLRMLEFGIFNPSSVEDMYKKDIETMTNYIKNNQMPEKEKTFLFDPDKCNFELNWKVGYSNYITKLYGYENQFAFDNANKGKVASWKRVFTRVIEGANITKLNLEVIKDIKKSFPNFDELVEATKKKGGDKNV